MSRDQVLIVEDDPQSSLRMELPVWKVLIVDDDESVHQATIFALDGFTFEDRKLKIYSAHSGVQARSIIQDNADIAVMLLDVVMESEKDGLDLVRWVRDEFCNQGIRIVLRTGQPGYAPELQVVRDYDINDYKEKSDLTAGKLVTTIYAALRSYRDITALRNQTDELTSALHRAEEANRSKNNFITNMSHEFRTPLNGIIGLTEMIATEMLGPIGNDTYREYAWDILSSGRILQSLIENVLEFAQDSETTPLAIETFDLRLLIDDFLEQTASKTPRTILGNDKAAKKVSSKPLMLQGDPKAIRLMLTHLFTNALQHNPANCKVRISIRQLPDRSVALSVIDDGIGISADIIRKIGDPFNIDGDPYVTGGRGLGLGLSATKRLIEKHKGTMTVESELGKGTTVRLQFPSGSLVQGSSDTKKA